jgi:adenylate kinase
MILVIFGPQGCGKGTQAQLLAKSTGMKHFSMGDALRAEIKSQSAVGKKIKNIVEKGSLVPSKITNDLLKKALQSAKTGIILDGYPRNAEQMNFVKKSIHLDCAIEIELSKKESIRRISTRRVCPVCSKNYNTLWLKPKVRGKCDKCKVALIHRIDDKPAQILKRLKIYRAATLPLKESYRKSGILHIIDGSASIKKVHADIMKVVKCPENA